jgi:hypothetical protein
MEQIESIKFETEEDLKDVNEIVAKINLKVMSHGEEGMNKHITLPWS